MSIKTWAMTVTILIIFWGVILLVETFWWFWPLLPGGKLTHQIVMSAGGLFGIYWGIIYLLKMRKRLG